MDELQNIWDAYNENAILEQRIDENELKAQMITKSEDVLLKIKRTMRIDTIIMVIVTTLFIAVTFIINLQSKYTVNLFLFGMMVFLSLHYWIKHTLIDKHDFNKENIANILAREMKYLKWNKRLYIWGLPTLSGALYLYLQTILMPINFDTIDLDFNMLINYSLGLPFALGIYIITRWLYGRLFGKEIRILEEIISQLDH